ncbi:MAG: Nif3-like dinuclear metal center hexameric protein [Candidatus Sumerlaeaceae bacterium]|nr:Nif3-like dinuclear metal center hexameric protein [Candidatus Sumerlaeaceae bacterium]
MSVRVRDVVEAVDRVAPFKLAYEWDNVGLQIGDLAAPVKNIAVGLEVTEEFLTFAQRHRCELLLVHHPLIFAPIKSLSEQSRTSALICRIVRRNMSLIVAHTNLDRVDHGTNGVWADFLKLEERRPLEPCTSPALFKFTVFVPVTHVTAVIEAIHKGGGGRIGNYSRCTFRAPGTGTYQPEEGANPYQGKVGKFEEAQEVRLEALVPEENLKDVLREVKKVHPYEEVAYDVYPLRQLESSSGLGVVGRLPRAVRLAQLAKLTAQRCGAKAASLGGDFSAKVERVAIATGSVGTLADRITRELADVLITGEISYHKAQELLARGVSLICLGHAASEKVVAAALAKLVAQELEMRGKFVILHIFERYDDPCASL